LKLGDESLQMNDDITSFIKKLTDILFCTVISDPPIEIDFSKIGEKVLFNPLKHDSVDGFIKTK
jgi:hypothetical protein